MSERAEGRIRLLCGPWVHDIGFGEISTAGEVDFGRSAALSINDEQLRWFDYWLKDLDSGVATEPPIRMFVMGSARGGGLTPDLGRLSHGGSWRGASDWPPPDSENLTLYLQSDSSLRPSFPRPDSPPTVYSFDPNAPVPTVGSAMPPVPGNWSAGGSRILDGGPYDQRGRTELAFCHDSLPLESRSDLFAFRSRALAKAVEVTGDVEILLWVMTDCRDTDFTARLIDEYPPSDDHPNGFAMNLLDCIVRLRYRERNESAELAQPDQVYSIAFEPKAISNVFAAGHRIRLDLSSSNFPQFDVNPNSGGPLGAPSDVIRAKNTIFHDASRPSHIKLPTRR
jgi:predicted acyl esterase